VLLASASSWRVAARERPLESVTPPVTCPAWRCSTSGKNPGKLGVFWWLDLDREMGDLASPDADSFATADVWDYLSEAGYRNAVLNVPMTFPPGELAGTMVSGFGASFDLGTGDESITWPPEFEERLREEYDWKVGVDDVTTPAGVEETYDLIRSRFDLLEDLLDGDYDYLHLTVFYINMLQHKYGAGPETARGWELIDERVGRLDLDDTLLVLYSDHGHREVDRTFVVNRWLAERGHLALESRASDGVTSRLYAGMQRAGVSPKRAAALARRLLPGDLADRLLPSGYPISTAELAARVDWGATDAVALSQGPLYLNRERLGDDYGHFRTRLRRTLTGLTHEGEPVLDAVRPAENVYEGPYVEDGPDLLLRPAAGWEVYGGIVPSVFDTGVGSWTSGNDPEGVLLLNGPGVPSQELGERSLLDVAPTVLRVLDVPVPTDVDGSAVTAAFPNRDFGTDVREPLPADRHGRTDDEDLTERLVDLGYLE